MLGMTAWELGHSAMSAQCPHCAGMTEPCPPSEIDLLSQATAYVRPYFDRSVPVGDRLRNLWAAVVAARHLAASDQIENEFMQVARDAGFETDLGRHADDDSTARYPVGNAWTEPIPIGLHR
jgi:hypothetical protein